MERKILIKKILLEGLNLVKAPPKEPEYIGKTIHITKIAALIDNFGNEDVIEDPNEIKDILKDSDLWEDDMIFYSDYPAFGTYYIDDLINRFVKVGDYIFKVVDNN